MLSQILPLIAQPQDFDKVRSALKEPNGLVGFGETLNADLLQAAYRKGIFPWFNEDDPVLWWSPDPRACFYPEQFTLSRSMQKAIRNHNYQISLNQAFTDVVNACAEKTIGRPETWISKEIVDAYTEMHRRDKAHSIEVWQSNQLIGGLYGVIVGRIFCGESMFHRQSNTSKLALHQLVELAKKCGIVLIDCQLPNPHLMSLGAKRLSRAEFMGYLNKYGDSALPENTWCTRQLEFC